MNNHGPSAHFKINWSLRILKDFYEVFPLNYSNIPTKTIQASCRDTNSCGHPVAICRKSKVFQGY